MVPVSAGDVREPSGWRLVIPVFALFLCPVVLALVGATLGGPEANGQVGGALAGFAAGTLVGFAVYRLCALTRKEES